MLIYVEKAFILSCTVCDMGNRQSLSVARSVQLGYIHRLFPVINSSTVEHEENSSDMLAEHQTYP